MFGQRRGGLAGAIEDLFHGERESDALCTTLDAKDTLVVLAIRAGLGDPESL